MNFDEGAECPWFGEEHADAIKDIRACIERKDWSEALVIIDRFFSESGEPK